MRLNPVRLVAGAARGIGSPVLGGRRINGSAVKRLLLIGGVTACLVVVVSALHDRPRGAWPLLLAATGLLVAIADFHRKDRRVFSLLVGTWPVVAMVALAAARTPATKGATAQATMLGNQASMAGGDRLKALAIEAATVGAPTVWRWMLLKLGVGS